MNSFKKALLAMMVVLALSLVAQAQTQPPALPDAAASDPKALGWMQGFPPAPDKTIRFDNGSAYRFPALRWAFSHTRELGPTKNVWRGDGPVAVLPRAERPLDDITFTDMTGKTMTWSQSLARNYTDGILVLHKGQVVYEKYFGALEPRLAHSAFSITKSIVGTLAAIQVVEGKLDPAAFVTKYIPELKKTAYEDATVRQVMDMTVGVQFSENYADPKAEVWDYARSGGMLPSWPGAFTARTSTSIPRRRWSLCAMPPTRLPAMWPMILLRFQPIGPLPNT
jgi:hypothetical protein